MNIASRPLARFGIVIALATACIGVVAQDGESGRGKQMAAKLQERFASADANHDGRLTKDEAKAGMPFVYKHFDEIDKAKAGAITMADIAAFARDQRAAKKASN